MFAQYSTTQLQPVHIHKAHVHNNGTRSMNNITAQRPGGAQAMEELRPRIQPNATNERPPPLSPIGLGSTSVPALSSSPSSSSSGLSSVLSSVPSSPSLPPVRNRSKRPTNDDPIVRWVDKQCSMTSKTRPRSSSTHTPIPTPLSSDVIPVAKPTHAAAPAFAQAPAVDRQQPSLRRRRSRTEDSAALVLGAIPASEVPFQTTLEEEVHTKAQIYDMADWPYILPNTSGEQDRMVTQHYILRAVFGGDFSAPVRPSLESGCVVLDVGCGPGTWTMEMGTEFPKSTFIGLDRSSHFPRDIKPKNCHFRNWDVLQLPLPFPDNSVDYIFQRDLNWGLKAHTWAPLIKEYHRILKPGGWLEMMEQDLETQSSDKKEAEMNDKMIYGMSQRQQDPYVARHLPAMLVVDGFRRIESRFQSLPLGWGSVDSDYRSASGSDASSSNFTATIAAHHLSTLQALQPWLSLVSKMSPDKYTTYTSNLLSEWKRAETYVNWHCATGQKRWNAQA